MAFFNRSELGWLLGFLGAGFGAAGLGALFTARSVNTWYRTLRKPAWTPPDAAFGPVWTLLYALIAIAGWIVRRKALRDPSLATAATAAYRAWLAQLVLNVSWSAVFFGCAELMGTGTGYALGNYEYTSAASSSGTGALSIPLSWSTWGLAGD